MKKNTAPKLLALALMAALGVSFMVAEAQPPAQSRSQRGAQDPSQRGARLVTLVDRFDADHDGSISAGEKARLADFLAARPRFDTDQDGKLSEAEKERLNQFADALVKRWSEAKAR